MNDRVLRFPLITDQVIPTSYSQSHLGAIDEWSLMKDFTLRALLKHKMIDDDKNLFKRFSWTLSLHLRSSTTCTKNLSLTRCQEDAKLRFYKIFCKCLASYNPIEAQKRN